MKRMIKIALFWGGNVFFIIILFILVIYRPWALHWGATHDEITRKMPGDTLVNDPSFNATRGVTIKARPEEIWPWIVQIGYKRAGFYSYDRLDNDKIPSAERIIPEYQELKVGDLIPLSKSCSARVIIIEPNKSMLLIFRDCGLWSGSSWLWELYQKDAQHTRLLTRLRIHTDSIITRIGLDLFEIFMMRKCMLGIKQRAENIAKSD